MKNIKQISAAVLAIGLLTSTSVAAMANETNKVDSSKFETVNLQDALNNVKEKTTTMEDLKTISTNIPIGYFANNIFALSINLEKISNPKAKAALQKNIDKAIVKWEEKNKVEVIETEKQNTETPIPVSNEVKDEPTEQTVEEENPKNEVKVDKSNGKQERKAAHNLKKEQKKQQKGHKKNGKGKKKDHNDHKSHKKHGNHKKHNE